MSRKSSVAITLIASTVVVAFLMPILSAQEQQGCTEIRGVIQGILPSPYPIAPDGIDVWGGSVYASLGGEPLIGIMSGNDGGESQHGGRGGHYKVYLCGPDTPGALQYPPACPDSFTYEVPNSVFGFAPGKVGLGDYKGNTAKIVSGTGRFLGATGNLNIAGPYILWADSGSVFGVDGRWNGEFSGRICGVK
jgi:hypothetical protein